MVNRANLVFWHVYSFDFFYSVYLWSLDPGLALQRTLIETLHENLNAGKENTYKTVSTSPHSANEPKITQVNPDVS